MARSAWRLVLGLVTMFLAICAVSCRFTAPERKIQSGAPAHGADMTQNQVRLRMRGLVGPMCGEIEQAADHIIGSTTNRAVKLAALEWKIEGVPEMRQALFQPDPLTAAIDAWVLSCQMADYFDTGPGKAALGEFSPIAVAGCRKLEEMIAQVEAARTVSGDVSKVRAYARRWAADHPIQHSISGRETTLSRVLDREALDVLSGGAMLFDVTTAVDDLNRRLEIYTGQLVRQARWEAELFKSEFLADVPLDQALPLAERAVRTAEQAEAGMDHILPAVERAMAVAENTPQMISSEREAAIKALHVELARTIQFVQEERTALLAHLTKERIAALQTLDERLAFERKAATEDFHRISLGLVDHAIWRLAELAAVMLVAVFISAVLLLLLTRRLF